MHTCPACGEIGPDRARFCPSCGAPVDTPVPRRAVRKLVTVVFCDLVGSTQLGERLDPEAVRQVLDRYFDTLRSVLEAHGGTVEKYIGDAVMAVFGVPVAHEDDALRAARAALDMVAGVDRLNPGLRARWGVELQVRVGVNTGEVIAGDAAGNQRLASGDAVNLAARLEAAAGAGEVLLGSSTYRLVRGRARAEARDPIMVKGKAEAVTPYRLIEIGLTGSTDAAGLRAPLVGRDGELALLAQTLGRALDLGTPQRVTILGAAGVGKSRLLAEFLDRYAGAATVLTGRCLSYGQGITFWPVREMLAEAAGWAEGDAVADSLGKLADLLPGDPDAPDIADRVGQLIGVSEPSLSLPACFLGLRQLLERLGRWKPLVLVVDDIHWAEPALLELLDYLTGTTKAPLLLLCGARPEPTEPPAGVHPATDGGELLHLRHLGTEVSMRLLRGLLGGDRLPDRFIERVLAAAEGNPLFLEQLVAMFVDDGTLQRTGGGGWTVVAPVGPQMLPDSVAALLTARLDRLPLAEQQELEAASVVGRVFWRGAVAELAGEALGADAGRHLETLVGRRLIAVDGSTAFSDDAYRFAHILVRDASYARMLKADRATAHQRLAAWLVSAVGDRVAEYQEIIGYHLEQTYRLRATIGVPNAQDAAVALEAGRTLAAAGQRAWARGDVNATANLLGRAAELLSDDAERHVETLTTLGRVAYLSGDMGVAETRLEDAVALAEELGDRRRLSRARVTLAEVWRSSGRHGHLADSRRICAEAIATMTDLGDQAGLAEAWQLKGLIALDLGRHVEAEQALEKALQAAYRSDDPTSTRDPMFWLAQALRHGPTPVADAIARIDRMLSGASREPYVEAALLHIQAVMAAMLGDFATAKPLFSGARATLRDLGMGLLLGGSSQMFRDIVLREGDLGAAEEMLREDERALADKGEEGIRSTNAAMLAEILIERRDFAEGEQFLELAESITQKDDLLSVVLCLIARAKLLALRDEAAEALDLARSAVQHARTSEEPPLQAEALITVGFVEHLVGDWERGDDALRAAVEILERKGDLALAARAAAMLHEPGGS